MYIWAWFISRHAGNMTDKLSERELKSLKSKIFWEQLDYLRDELGDPGRYFAFLKRKNVLEQEDCDSIRAKSTAQEKVDVFVTIIHNRESSQGESAFDVFVEALKSQKVKVHIARSLLRAFAKRKNEIEIERRRGVDSQVEVQTQLQQTASPPVTREVPPVPTKSELVVQHSVSEGTIPWKNVGDSKGTKFWEKRAQILQASDSGYTELDTKTLSEGASLERDDKLERVKQEYKHQSEAVHVQALEEIVERKYKALEAIKQELSQTRVTSVEQLVKREIQVNQCKLTIQMYQTLYQKQLQQIQSLVADNKQLREQQIQMESADGSTLMAAVPIEQSARSGYLRGVDITGETNLLVTNDAQTFHWVGYGLKLHIPAASLPAGVEKSSIEIRASLAGQYQLPENTTLISAVYWIKCAVKLAQLLTLELQHCGKHSSNSPFSFVVTKRSQKELPYQFTLLKGGEFNFHSSYGSITLSHFCGLGVVQEGSEEQLYCARLYYLGSRIDWRVDFVITKDLEAEYKAISYSYAATGAIEGLHQEVEFTADEITLDIPADGIIVREGWSIKPLIHPTVMKKQVTQYRSGRRIPSCRLSVKWVKPEELQPLDLCHRVNMQGAKEPCNYFTIEADPQPKALQATSSVPDTTIKALTPDTDTAKLFTTEPKPSQLMDLVAAEIPSKWRLMGIQLYLKDTELDCIEVTSDDPMRCFSSVFTLWKRKETRLPLSWWTVLQALEAPSVGEQRLARHIRCQLTEHYKYTDEWV